MRPGVPDRVLGLRQLRVADLAEANEARIRHGDDDVADVCVVGAGAGGGTVAARLAEAGLRVVVLEAGPFWVPERDWVSDEKGAARLYWRELRVSGGADPLELGANNSGRGVGGSTVHHTMVKLRFHRHDFRLRSKTGQGDDWPIDYADLAPWYAAAEEDLGVAGPSDLPWGERRGPFPQRAHPLTSQARVLAEGCERLGLRWSVTPTATLSSPRDGRPPCTYRGFCAYGCKPNAKSSTLTVYVPRAVAAGAVFKHHSMAVRLEVEGGRVRAVRYRHAGREHAQRARTFVLAGSAIETPRLLLASGGVANASGLVGKRLMAHSSHRVYARFDRLVRPYKGPPGLSMTQDLYDAGAGEGWVGGLTVEAAGALPLAFAGYAAAGARVWGWDLRRLMLDFNRHGGAALNGECLPYATNEVRLAAERDAHGLPVAHVRFAWGDNERRMVECGLDHLERIVAAAGGRSPLRAPDTAHLMGTCRMGDDARGSVVDPDLRAWDVPNLFLCDASVFVTSSGVNPSLTIEALALRLGDHLARRRE